MCYTTSITLSERKGIYDFRLLFGEVDELSRRKKYDKEKSLKPVKRIAKKTVSKEKLSPLGKSVLQGLQEAVAYKCGELIEGKGAEGRAISYFIPASPLLEEQQLSALKHAASQLELLLKQRGISEDEIVVDFQKIRGKKDK